MLALLFVACHPPAPVDDSVILVGLDPLGADWIGAYGRELPLTPNLDASARDEVPLQHAYSRANVTELSHGGVVTSHCPCV